MNEIQRSFFLLFKNKRQFKSRIIYDGYKQVENELKFGKRCFRECNFTSYSSAAAGLPRKNSNFESSKLCARKLPRFVQQNVGHKLAILRRIIEDKVPSKDNGFGFKR